MTDANHTKQSIILSNDEVEELKLVFDEIDFDNSGFISVSELSDALCQIGLRVPYCEVRDIVQKADTNIRDDQLDFDEFKMLFATVKDKCDVGSKFLNHVITRSGLDNYGGMSPTSAEGTTHTVRQEEQVAFSNWINRKLSGDEDCSKYIPVDPESRDLYVKCSDGVILCKLINLSQSGTIDERAINTGKLNIYQIHENLTLALTSAQSIGCNIVNIGPEDLKTGRPHLVLGLLWQIIRIGLISDINLHDNPGLALLVEEGNTIEDFQKLSPDEVLLRWVNHHLLNSNSGKQINNFSSDIVDSIAYIYLLHQIAPKEAKVTLDALKETDPLKRAELTLKEAEKIGCRSFISAQDIVNGNQKLNSAFVANLFNSYAGLELTDKDMKEVDLGMIVEETREEKSYRNWMNSLGVSPYVNHLYGDLNDGLIIFQIYDVIKPGMVDHSKVIKDFHKLKVMMEKIENCNYVVELGKSSKFSLVGIDGKNLYDCNPTLTLALVWQLMKAYTISILMKLTGSKELISDKEIVTWVNDKLKGANKKTSLHSFNDPSISDVYVLLDVIDACKKGSINYDLVQAGQTDQDKLDRAKYAITMARKIGAPVYALPEDIVEVKSKMVMTVFACLMINDLQPKTSHHGVA